MNLSTFKEITRWQESLFGLLPIFASCLLAVGHQNIADFFLDKYQLTGLIILAFLFARIAGMSLNRLIDKNIDAKNPRTQNRSLPAGKVSIKQVKFVAYASLLLFVSLCLSINFLCFIYGCIAAGLIWLYSYTKRFYAGCHFILGIIHAFAPIMTYIALTGHSSLASIYLGFAILCSITASDIIYAIQDQEFDCLEKLHSIPVFFGIAATIKISRILQCFAIMFLLLIGPIAKLSPGYYLMVAIATIVIINFQIKIKKTVDLKLHHQINPIFFITNVLFGLSIFIGILIGKLWHV